MEAFFLVTYRLIIWREAWVIFAKNMFLEMLLFYLLSLPIPPQLLQIVSIIVYLIYHHQHHIDVYVWSFPN